MASRFYLPSSGSAAVSPSYTASWDDTSVAERLPSSRTKSSTAETDKSFNDNDDTDKDILRLQYVTEQLGAQTITAQTVGLSMRCRFTGGVGNIYLALTIKAVSSDGSTVRGTLLALTRDGTSISSSTGPAGYYSRYLSATTTEVTIQNGDRLVFEIGAGGDPAMTQDHDFILVAQDDKSTDLDAADNDDDDENPWINFANTLSDFVASTTSTTSSSSSITTTSSSSSSSITTTSSSSSITTTSSSSSSSITTTSSSSSISTTTTSSSSSITTTSSSSSISTTTTSSSSSISVTTTSSSSSITTTSSSTTLSEITTSTTSTSSSSSSSSSITTTSSSSSITTTSSSSSISVTTTTSSSSSTTTTLDPLSGGLCFGEESPTDGEIPISWQTFSNGSATIPTIIGDADWGKMQLNLTQQGRSSIYDFGDSNFRQYSLTRNKYGTGQGTAILQIRGDTSLFLQDDILPAWNNYSIPIIQSWRYIQIREINQ